jgi:23S rRNA pseudouridine2605 synthase
MAGKKGFYPLHLTKYHDNFNIPTCQFNQSPPRVFRGRSLHNASGGMYYRKDQNMAISKKLVASKNPVVAKYIADAGICSRRKAQEFVSHGLVTVNGQVLKDLAYRVNSTDKVIVDGQRIKPVTRKIYILLNKPKDYITTLSDQADRRTVMDLISGVRERIYPVGRLDRNTTGLLLLTNDGALAQRLSHPSHEVQKVYHVVLASSVNREHLKQMMGEGVVLEDGVATFDAISYVPRTQQRQVQVTIHSGKNRIVRRMFEALGYEVIGLDRVEFAGLSKYGLRLGNWRFLANDEVEMLYKS